MEATDSQQRPSIFQRKISTSPAKGPLEAHIKGTSIPAFLSLGLLFQNIIIPLEVKLIWKLSLRLGTISL